MPAASHPVFNQPPDARVPIWRYIDFAKYVSLLATGSLFLARADRLGDPFEGSYTRQNLVRRRDLFARVGLPAGELARILQHVAAHGADRRKMVFVNCWHMNEAESAAMWKLYARTEEAVALRTNYCTLRDVLDSSCFLGRVEYVDYDAAAISESNLFFPFLHKRRSFSHEREVRIVKTHVESDDRHYYLSRAPQGLSVPVDLARLVERVYVAPSAKNWYRDLVESVTARYGYSFTVHQSRLDDEPLF